MNTKKIAASKTLALSLFIFVFFCLAQQSSDSILALIDKAQLSGLPSSWLSKFWGLQEFESSWLVRISGDLVSKLRERGSVFEVLDTAPAGKAYFLVYAPEPGHLESLKHYGEARRLDDVNCLFWTGTEYVREILPPEFEIKRLFLEDRIPLKVERPLLRKPLLSEKDVLTSFSFNSLIPMMVSQVSEDNLRLYIQSLENFQTRYSSTANCEAAGTFIHDFFSRLGLPTEYDPFSFSGGRFISRNIVATIHGKTSPDRVVIVCGHYDSYSNQATMYAPGADDNASGTAAVMEIGRIMAGHEFDFSVKLVAFSAEEWGLYGSRHYAQAARQKKAKIIGVINMDMIAYTDQLPEELDVVVNQSSEWLSNRFIFAATIYAPMDFLKVVNASLKYSDHSSFWDQGYSALLGIEDVVLKNPHYHKITDTLDTLNLDFLTAVTRASLSVATDLAQPKRSPQPPTGLTARSQVSSSLFWSTKTVYLAWNHSPDLISGYNIYRSTISHGPYTKVNSAIITQNSYVDKFIHPDIVYYYVVTTVDGQGRESNYSEEVSDSEHNKAN